MPRQTQAMKPLSEIIRAEIAASGILSFARFMGLALYCPDFGYYEQQKDNVGRRGDFYTSVSTGELFGELLAFQFAEWLEELRIADCGLRIVEAGAHDGRLAKDILNWLQLYRPKLFSEIEYVVLEPSPNRQHWQHERLKEFSNVRWIERVNDPKQPPCSGIIFSNELLDAFPVHRLGWDAKNKEWFEWGVALDGEKFVWQRMMNSRLFRVSTTANMFSPWRGQANTDLDVPWSFWEVLPDNYTIEISPAAENWWHKAAKFLQRGKLLTVDYGLVEEEIFSPARANGTLRAYHRHRATDDLLANPGEQDLTAHINFSVIQKIGEEAGLKTEDFCSQPQFLTRILEKAAKDNSFGEWNASRPRQFQTLTHPEHLGRAFRVLVQSR
jgi:SAM-dependent MidA family methyltransferase